MDTPSTSSDESASSATSVDERQGQGRDLLDVADRRQSAVGEKDTAPDENATLVEEANEEDYDVEAILHKEHVNEKLCYEVKWVGYEETTWEPVENCCHLVLVKQYEAAQKVKKTVAPKVKVSKKGPETKAKKEKKARQKREKKLREKRNKPPPQTSRNDAATPSATMGITGLVGNSPTSSALPSAHPTTMASIQTEPPTISHSSLPTPPSHHNPRQSITPPLTAVSHGPELEALMAKGVPNWTVHDVARWVNAVTGSETNGERFVQDEIDGTALLMLNFHHLQNGLGMKLGPAVKLDNALNRLKGLVES